MHVVSITIETIEPRQFAQTVADYVAICTCGWQNRTRMGRGEKHKTKCPNSLQRRTDMDIRTIHDFRHAVRHPYAWPGGYPTYFICEDGGALCHACAKQERRNILESIYNHYRDGWRVVGLDINWEDSTLYCDNCSDTIESAYGEDE